MTARATFTDAAGSSITIDVDEVTFSERLHPPLPAKLAELAGLAAVPASLHWHPGTTCVHCEAQAVSRCDCCCGLFCADHGHDEICESCRRG